MAQKILVDKELLDGLVNTLRDVSIFMGQGFHNRANEILKDVLSKKNIVSNLLIVNPDMQEVKAIELIGEIRRLEIKIFGQEWQLNDEAAAKLKVESDRKINELLSLITPRKD